MAPGIVSPQRSFKYDGAFPASASLDASKLRITQTLHPSKLPPAEDLTFGSHTTGKCCPCVNDANERVTRC
jgi:branched-chain amino acid aminotransferase